MRVIFADLMDLLGPLLLILLAVLPRMLKRDKQQKSRPASGPGPAARPPIPRRGPVDLPPPPPPQPARELADLEEILQEMLGRRKAEPNVDPQLEPEMEPEPVFIEVEGPAEEPYVRDYYKEPAEPAYHSDYKQTDFQEAPDQPWSFHHSLKADQLSDTAPAPRAPRHRALLAGRDSLRDLIVLREVLGPPRSLQPMETWDQGGA